MNKLTTEHQLVLSRYIINELKDVTHRKFPSKEDTVNTLLKQLPFKLVETPAEPEEGLFEIRDVKDYPVLCSAISADVDVLITNDKDFDDVKVDLVTKTGLYSWGLAVKRDFLRFAIVTESLTRLSVLFLQGRQQQTSMCNTTHLRIKVMI